VKLQSSRKGAATSPSTELNGKVRHRAKWSVLRSGVELSQLPLHGQHEPRPSFASVADLQAPGHAAE